MRVFSARQGALWVNSNAEITEKFAETTKRLCVLWVYFVLFVVKFFAEGGLSGLGLTLKVWLS
jgi:hypothetical protein